jgi:mannose-1-phosphate guanylyltransferase
MVDGAYWLDTGTPQAYLQANVDILNGRQGMHEFTNIVNCSWRHPSSTVDASATLTNSVVDSDCVVGANVILEETVLLPGAIVQSNCVIRSSIIGPGAVIGRFSQLGATCVVGANEHVAPASELSGEVRLGGV